MKYLIKLLDWKNILEFVETNLIKIIISIIVFKILKYSKKYVDKILKTILIKAKVDEGISTFIRSLFSVFYFTLVFYIIIGFFGININSITAFIGAAGLIFGLAFKETLANFCGGIIILTFKPFKVGDVIEFNNYIGEVKSIELFYTKIKNPQHELVIIPNGMITNNEVRNITKEEVRRLDLRISVSYNSDIKQVKEELKNIVNELTKTENVLEDDKYILRNPEAVIGVGELADSAIIFDVYVYVDSDKYLKVKHKLNEEIKIRFDEKNIEIPYPQMDIHINQVK